MGVPRLTRFSPRWWVLVCLSLGALRSLCLPGAEPLPDAAAHIGSVVINQDDEFTTNPAVVLTLNAVDNGSGVAQMQFSNDDQSWSDPEPYQTTKQWMLAPASYPPAMSTVLETVYVQFSGRRGPMVRGGK